MIKQFAELNSSRALLRAWTGRTIRARYQQSILGWLWAVVQPLASVVIFTIIFTYFVPFHIEAKIEVLKNSLNADVIPGNCEIFELLKIQLEEYFNKQRTTFEIHLQLIGTSFQEK